MFILGAQWRVYKIKGDNIWIIAVWHEAQIPKKPKANIAEKIEDCVNVQNYIVKPS